MTFPIQMQVRLAHLSIRSPFTHKAKSSQALSGAIQLLSQAPHLLARAQAFEQKFGHRAPPCACFPRPRVQLSGAPAGKGLTKNPKSWPKGSIRTAGGYTIVAHGARNAWSIYAPGQKPTDNAHTHIWGDPHVNEKDGTNWDFTKSSNFVLPDGTRIHAKTTSETGASISKALTITNGADRVNISGIDINQPKVGEIKQDGYEWRAEHTAKNRGVDTYRLGGDKKYVHWFKERHGRIQGRVDGSSYNAKTQQYEQHLYKKTPYWVSKELRPALGSPAWGNQLRAQVADVAGLTGNRPFAKTVGSFLFADHFLSQNALTSPWGGLPMAFPDWANTVSALHGCGCVLSRHEKLADVAKLGILSYLNS